MKPARGTARFHHPKLTPLQNKAVEMRRNGFSIEEIADEMEIGRPRVSVLLSEARRYVDVPHYPRGHGRMRIVDDVLRLKALGLTAPQIAARINAKREDWALPATSAQSVRVLLCHIRRGRVKSVPPSALDPAP